RSRSTSHREPTAPVFGSHAPKTTRATRASPSAPAHIVQGSTVTATVQPSSRQLSTTRAASRSASSSACAVGSPVASRALQAAASSRPDASTTTAPIGTSPVAGAAAATSSARRTSASSEASGGSVTPGAPRGGSLVDHLGERVGEPAAAGDRRQLLVRVELHLGGEHLQLVGGQAEVGEDPEVALGPRRCVE